jgi:N-acetylneuraminate synthase
MSSQFNIGNRAIGGDAPCFIIGEVAQAHDGSLGTAHAYIDAIADAGADAVKFQTHIASAESTPAEPWRVAFSRQDATRYEYWRRMEFTAEQWAGLKQHAKERGLVFLSSPFSIAACRLLESLQIAAWKIASGELNNEPLLDFIAATGKPVILSSGMSAFSELDTTVQRLQAQHAAFAVLQCTSMYPTPPEKVGLHLLPELAARYGCPVGLSDHSGVPYTSFAAITLGAKILELHVAFSRECFGPDVVASVTTSELRDIVRGSRFIEAIRSAAHHSKDELANEVAPLRQLFTKSIVAAHDLPAGTIIGQEHLELKKPGGGMSAEGMTSLVGRRLRVDVRRDEMIQAAMVEGLN